ncbi:hypothetical protein LR48_Vigan07g017300 [Vigna angularis]|uniref:Phospholipid/glycerol acyltransferase domain-containing protein n=1 Tax=Phaseolus angularis TaxID=3914 RepID=A0A0L9UVC1_PHAAN|nr:hypothetical protein LR48_Vigan07g017300 [Vigna angularis]
MEFPMMLLRLAEWVLYQLLANSYYRAARKMKSYGFHFGVLLRSHSFFPYFMLVAFEGGSIFRAFLLLLSCPVLWILNLELRLKVMTFITFCGLRTNVMDSISRAVLPKFYLENLNLRAYEVLASAGSKVVFTSVPRVMVEGFLKEYLSVDAVVGTELHTVGCYFSGLLSGSGLLVKHRALKDYFGDTKPDIGVGSSAVHDHLFLSLCKIIIQWTRFYQVCLNAFIVSNFSYMDNAGSICGEILPEKSEQKQGVLYVCTHRTLLDPVFLSTCLAKPLTAVTYSLSKVSELIAPIRTVRLTRDRKKDGETMERLLREGDLVVCPEGTTCREPYLLRFSSLFAELADEIVPVAINTHVSMFYGTTASGLKCLDPIFFLMNPRPSCYIQVLGKLPRELTCAGGRSSCEVANFIQKQLADALGFECTTLTRRDKYMMLAGNEGIVQQDKRTTKC